MSQDLNVIVKRVFACSASPFFKLDKRLKLPTADMVSFAACFFDWRRTLYVYVNVCMYLSIYLCVCVCVCVCVHVCECVDLKRERSW